MFTPANQAHFTLSLEGVEHDFKVLEFRGREAISQPYRFDLELVSDLRSFHSEYRDGIPYALIRLEINLVDTRSQKIIASRRLDAGDN